MCKNSAPIFRVGWHFGLRAQSGNQNRINNVTECLWMCLGKKAEENMGNMEIGFIIVIVLELWWEADSCTLGSENKGTPSSQSIFHLMI